MNKRTIVASSEAEALFLEQAKAMYQEMNQTACEAEDGTVLDKAEQVAVTKGRELIRKGLEIVIQDQAQDAEKKARPRGDVLAMEIARIAAENRKR